MEQRSTQRALHSVVHPAAVHGTLSAVRRDARVTMRSAHLVVDGGHQHRRARVLQTARRCGGSPAPAVHCSAALSPAYQVGTTGPSAPPQPRPLRGLRGRSRCAQARRSRCVLSDQATHVSEARARRMAPSPRSGECGFSRVPFTAILHSWAQSATLRNRGGWDRSG